MDEKQLHAIPQLLNAEAETISTEYNIADAAEKWQHKVVQLTN